MNDLLSNLGTGLLVIIGLVLLVFFIATIIFRVAAKWVTKQDVPSGKSLAIVFLGFVASIAASFPTTILLSFVGAPELFVTIISSLLSFCSASGVYLLMLKISFWKASLIQVVMLLIVLLIIFTFSFAFGALMSMA